MEAWMILAAIVLVPCLLLIIYYNRLVALRLSRQNAFSDIDVQLHQRFDLIPNLVETVKAYAAHEKSVLENVTQARAQVGRFAGGASGGASGAGTERLQAEGALSSALVSLYAVAENYPQLKADGNFQRLMAELSDIENKVAAARRFFNNATNEYNTVAQQFPSNIVAKLFGFSIEAFFELPDSQAEHIRTAPKVSF